MVPPNPDLLRRYRNTDQIIKSGMSDTVPSLYQKYPNDYLDLITYESIKRAMQFP